MMKLLPEGSNYFQDANCPRSTDWVVSDVWAAVYYELWLIRTINLFIWFGVQKASQIKLNSQKLQISVTDIKLYVDAPEM